MAVRIRLKRIGKNPKGHAYFRIAVFDETRNRDSLFIEEIGIYDPAKKPALIKINQESYASWVKKGAKPTDTVLSLAKKAKKEVKNAAASN